jgi:ABC-type Mn2+/Zn2+ transport system ATPase subunit
MTESLQANHPNAVSDPLIEVSQLTRRFGARTALDSVSLTVPRGAVFGLVGENGAGKTTLIKHLLGLLRAERGTVRVFGRDPVADPVGVLSRIGYLSEDDRPDEGPVKLTERSLSDAGPTTLPTAPPRTRPAP